MLAYIAWVLRFCSPFSARAPFPPWKCRKSKFSQPNQWVNLKGYAWGDPMTPPVTHGTQPFVAAPWPKFVPRPWQNLFCLQGRRGDSLSPIAQSMPQLSWGILWAIGLRTINSTNQKTWKSFRPGTRTARPYSLLLAEGVGSHPLTTSWTF